MTFILIAFVVVAIAGWLVGRSRYNKAVTLRKVIIALIAFFVAIAFAGMIISEWLWDDFLLNSPVWLAVVATPLTMVLVVLFYYLLNKLTSSRKELGKTPLDTDLIKK